MPALDDRYGRRLSSRVQHRPLIAPRGVDHASDYYQGGLADPRLLTSVRCPALSSDYPLSGQRHDGQLLRVSETAQFSDDLLQLPSRGRTPWTRPARTAWRCRPQCLAGRPGNDQVSRRPSVYTGSQGRRCREQRAYARNDVDLDPMLPSSAICSTIEQRGVAAVQANYLLACPAASTMIGTISRYSSPSCPASWPRTPDKGGIDQRTGIYQEVGGDQQLVPFHGDEVRVTWAGSHEPYHGSGHLTPSVRT